MQPHYLRFMIGSGLVALIACPMTARPAEDSQLRIGSSPSEVYMAKITVADLRKSLDFYTHVVGLKEVQIPGLPKPNIDDPNAEYAEVFLNFSGSSGDAFIALFKKKGVTPNSESARLTSLGIKTTDARAAVDRAKAAGAIVQSDTAEFRGLTMGLIRDPDGYLIQFLQGPAVDEVSNVSGKRP